MLPSQSVSLHPHFPIVPIRRHFCSSLRRTGHGRISAQNKENAPSDYLQLEMEVFQFMESSGQLDVFPSKKDLINAGRYDLANSIEKQGGWLAVGFEDEAEEDFSGPSQFSAAGELVDPSLLNWSQSLDRSKASRLRTSNRIHFGGSAEQGVGSREPVVEDLTEVQTSGLEFLGSEILGPSAEVRGADADLTEVQTSGLEFLDSGVVGPSADVRSADVSGGLPAVESSQIPEIKSERSFLSQLDAVRDKLLASLGLDFPPPVIPKYETPVSSAESLELESEMPEPGTLGSLQPQEARVGDSGIGELSSKDRSFELELEWPQPGTSESLSLQPQESIVGDSETAAERIEQSKGGGLAEEEVPDVDSETRQLAESGQEIEGQSGGESEESAQDTVPVGAEGIAPGVAQESAPGVNATQRPSGAAEQEENAASTELEVLVGGEGTTDSAEEESTSEGALDTGSSSEAGGLSGLPALWQTNRGAALGQDSSASGPTLSAADSGDGGKRIGAGKRGEEIAAKKGGVSHEVEGKGRATEREGKAETVGSEVEAGRGGSPEGSETRTGETDRSQEGKGSETRMGERDRRSQEGKKSETRSGETDGSQEGKGRGGASSAAAESDGAPARPRKPRNFWRDIDNLRRELQSAQAALGLPDDVTPSRRQLIGLRRWDIVRAVGRQGGFKQLADRLGENEIPIRRAKEVKKVQKEKPAPPPPSPPSPPPPKRSPITRLLNLFGFGPKPAPQPEPVTPVPQPEPVTPVPEPDPVTPVPEPEPVTPVPEPEASSSSAPAVSEVNADDEEKKALDEQSVAQRLKESLAPEFWRRRKKRRRELGKKESERRAGVDGAEQPEEAGPTQDSGTKGAETETEAETKMETDTEGAETESDTEEAEPESDTEGAETKSNTEGADTESGAKEAETESGAGGGALMGRIRALEQSLAATREALQHDREALIENREFLREARITTINELTQVSDSLEFREDEMARTARSLRRTQAEMRALAGSMSSGSLGGPEAVDAILAGPENPPENSEGFPLEQRMVRVVWPHEGGEVELAGSFDGWEGKVKMEMSNAGVHIATLSLPPGRYEIKFIVDGAWRVDAQRLITYEDGNENNVLLVV